MTEILEAPVDRVSLRGPDHGETSPPERSALWELLSAFQGLQKVYREGRMSEREAAFQLYVHRVRMQGRGAVVHFQYALGFLALELSKMEPGLAPALDKVLAENARSMERGDPEAMFKDGLERIYRLALKPRQGMKEDRLDSARDFIRAHFQESIPLGKVAVEFGLSTSVFGRCFKERFGKGFSVFLRDLRVEKAKELLTHGQLSVERVSLESGFKNFHYFFEVFKKATGKTPHQFRRTQTGRSPKV
ncbi:MAG TPA: helix-turn-helix domain-containing protein [bacterium]|nr:helix-turn-helix domain-containing protein [bacterium]